MVLKVDPTSARQTEQNPAVEGIAVILKFVQIGTYIFFFYTLCILSKIQGCSLPHPVYILTSIHSYSLSLTLVLTGTSSCPLIVPRAQVANTESLD